MPLITVYGASDDLVEFTGYLDEEFGCYAKPWRGRLESPDGEGLDLTLYYGVSGWEISVTASENSYPAWPIYFGERPDRAGDPAVNMSVPEGTKIITFEDDE